VQLKCQLIQARPTFTNHAQPHGVAVATLARTVNSLLLVTSCL